MRINGKELAKSIFHEISQQSHNLPSNVTPTLAIITVGEESSWEAYVSQKKKRAEELKFNTLIYPFQEKTEQQVLEEIHALNGDPSTHGIIVQRPLPATMHTDTIISAIDKSKDVDGFRPDSPFKPPLWLAVKYILEYIYNSNPGSESFQTWLSSKRVVVVGKGETAGQPVINGLRSLGLSPEIVDTTTKNRDQLFQSADIIVSGVGKHMISLSDLHEGIILIGVGIRSESSRLKGDYSDEEVDTIASWYTPTPGGVGRVNLAFLMKNLLEATQRQIANSK